MKTKITGGLVVGHDGRDHVVYRDGAVIHEGGRVVFVGHGYPGPGGRTSAAGDAMIGPGLDALSAIDHGILDTWQPPEVTTGLAWSEDSFVNRRHDVFSREEEVFKRRYALARLILNGVTTAMPIGAETDKAWRETDDELADVAAIAGDLGLRMYLGPAYRSGITRVRADGTPAVLRDEPLGEAGLDEAIRFARDIDGAHGGSVLESFDRYRARGVRFALGTDTFPPDIIRAMKLGSLQAKAIERRRDAGQVADFYRASGARPSPSPPAGARGRGRRPWRAGSHPPGETGAR